METSVRYLMMLNLIPTYPRKISVQQLREKLVERDCELEISERTLQRDLLKLSSSFPLICDDCRPRGWSRPKDGDDASTGTVMTFAVAKALFDVERLAGKELPKEVIRALTPLFAQARSRIKSADHRVDYALAASPTEEIEYTTFQRAA